MCVAADESEACRKAFEHWPNAGLPGDLKQELALPEHFEQAVKLVDEETARSELFAEAVRSGTWRRSRNMRRPASITYTSTRLGLIRKPSFGYTSARSYRSSGPPPESLELWSETPAGKPLDRKSLCGSERGRVRTVELARQPSDGISLSCGRRRRVCDASHFLLDDESFSIVYGPRRLGDFSRSRWADWPPATSHDSLESLEIEPSALDDHEERKRMDLIALEKTNGKTGRGPVLEVVIETPAGSRNKFTYDEHVGVFRLHKILPIGFKFPFDFGFVPGTLDALIVADEPTFTGCVMSVRLLGVLAAEQTEGDKTIRNDRLIATPESAKISPTARTLDDLPARRLEQIQHFFIAYNRYENREFKIVKRQGAAAAVKLVAEGRRKHRQSKSTHG